MRYMCTVAQITRALSPEILHVLVRHETQPAQRVNPDKSSTAPQALLSTALIGSQQPSPPIDCHTCRKSPLQPSHILAHSSSHSNVRDDSSGPRAMPASAVLRCTQGVVVNSFGFFGALLVRDQEQLDWVIGHGAMRLLAKVGFPNERWEIPGDAVPKC